MEYKADHSDHHHSYETFDQTLVETLKIIQPPRILDIGAGKGKYGALIKSLELPSLPVLTALEPFDECKPSLERYYDTVDIASADDLFSRPGENYHTIIMGDVLEHMRFSQGLDLIHFLMTRCEYLIIITPYGMPMSIDGNFYASHNSLWRPESLHTIDHFLYARAAVMYFYIIRGFGTDQTTSLHSIQSLVNTIGLQAHFPQTDTFHQVELQLHSALLTDPARDLPHITVQYRNN